ncbi:hypothetical protein [Sulfodiicoccus acidiphilus]|nr:hypothetical protein [Sulfodiicoccus acidiphilus]
MKVPSVRSSLTYQQLVHALEMYAGPTMIDFSSYFSIWYFISELSSWKGN